jgi:hypothetical protein
MSNTDVGYGSQFPDDSNTDSTGISFIVRALLSRIDTMKVVQVKGVHPGQGTPPAPGTVDVQPLVNQIDFANPPNATPHGIVYGLPFIRWQGGMWAVINDPAINDIGIIICADRDISTVKNTKAQANPGSFRRLNVADGVYLGGILNATPAATFWLKPDGTMVIADINGNTIATTATGMTLLDVNANQIQMLPGVVNIVTASFQVNGTPVTIP